ncbi:hypothetical protein HCN44_000180 [Aphidius gifuensis]|uniref:Uncharacterized protein n=1 Tax=Aphidius gifuensis TaxID=684658 RepID=A0A834XNI5_APHGI|nr:hypothetical protein HCN44_000180 [Aphidius gifuensis]
MKSDVPYTIIEPEIIQDVTEIPEELICELEGTNDDAAIAQLLQKQFNQEYDLMLKKTEEKYNGVCFNTQMSLQKANEESEIVKNHDMLMSSRIYACRVLEFLPAQQNQGFGAQPAYFNMTNSVYGLSTTTSNTFGGSAGSTNSFAALATTPQQQNLFQNNEQNTTSPMLTNPSPFDGSINLTSTFGNNNNYYGSQNVDVNSGSGASVLTSVSSNQGYGNAPAMLVHQVKSATFNGTAEQVISSGIDNDIKVWD